MFFILYVGTYVFIDLYFVNRMFIKKELDAVATIQKVQIQYIEKWLNENLNMIVYLSNTKSARENDTAKFKLNAKGFASVSKRFTYISFIDPSGQGVFNSMNEKPDISLTVSDREYFKQAIRGKAYISGFIESRIDKSLVIVFSAPVYDSSQNIKGILCGSAAVDDILETLKWDSMRKTGSSYLIGENGQIFTNTEPGGEKAAEPIKDVSMQPVNNGQSKAGIFVNYKGQKVIGVRSKMEVLPDDYTIVTEINYDEATLEIRKKIIVYFIIFTLLFLIISKKVFDLFQKRYFKQLKELGNATQEFSKVKIYTPIKTEYKNEIGDLMYRFDDMMKSIDDYQNELQAKILELDTEKKVLKENNVKLMLLSEQHEVAMGILDKQNKQLEEANTAKSNFIANVSHELRNPLNVIINYLEYLSEEHDGALSDEQKKSIVISLNSANRLHGMISDMLDLSSLETGKVKFKYSNTDLADLLKSICNDKAIEISEKGLELKLTILTQEKEMITDGSKLRLALDNILVNAIKFTKSGLIEVILDKKDNRIEIDIKDEGIGIQTDKLEQVFEPFYQVDSSYRKKYKGVGLGLSISKNVVESLGGSISVLNNPEKGCTFKIALPTDYDLKEEQL